MRFAGLKYSTLPFPTTFVGSSFGRFLSQRQVVLVASSPNIHGCMIWSGFLISVDMTDTGFSMAILGTLTPIKSLTKSNAKV
jgi:hypothetical protein